MIESADSNNYPQFHAYLTQFLAEGQYAQNNSNYEGGLQHRSIAIVSLLVAFGSASPLERKRIKSCSHLMSPEPPEMIREVI